MREAMFKSAAVVGLMVLILVLMPQIVDGADYPTPMEGDYRITNFEFVNGEVLPELNLHYTTIGRPHGCQRSDLPVRFISVL